MMFNQAIEKAFELYFYPHNLGVWLVSSL
jgi:hypothetical protein